MPFIVLGNGFEASRFDSFTKGWFWVIYKTSIVSNEGPSFHAQATIPIDDEVPNIEVKFYQASGFVQFPLMKTYYYRDLHGCRTGTDHEFEGPPRMNVNGYETPHDNGAMVLLYSNILVSPENLFLWNASYKLTCMLFQMTALAINVQRNWKD